MLGEDFVAGRRKSRSTLAVILLLGISKALRASALCFGFTILHHQDLPVLLYTFYTVVGASIVFLGIQKPWSHRKPVDSAQWLRIIFYSLFLLLNLFFWNNGLKYYGPIRTILSSDYADLALGIIFSSFILGRDTIPGSTKVKGAFVLIAAYLLIFLVEPSTAPQLEFWTTTTSPQIDNDNLNNNDLLNATPSDLKIETATSAHDWNFWLFTIPETKIGGVCLFIAIWLTFLRKNLARKLSVDFVGGSRTLYALSMPAIALMLSPFAGWEYLNLPVESSLSVTSLIAIMAVVFFAICGDFYVESMVSEQLDVSTMVITSLSSSFGAAILVEQITGIGEWSMLTVLCFVLTLIGMHILFRRDAMDPNEMGPEDISSPLPVYSNQSMPRGNSVLSMNFVKISFRQILSTPESRRIFFYLVFNLMFMFVEMLYGYLTNSLGLISDAFHMLFDCTALIIGLFASVIANWEPNQYFSYGYGRAEVLSGFINALFLVLIAVSVLKESVDRIWSPQEIKTEKLLLVSCMGLCVNLVGVFAFHDLHDHGYDEGGHSHSHGGGHGHSHGKEESSKNNNHNHSEHNHSHSNGTHKGHDDHDDHSDHGHSHAHGNGENHDHSHSHSHSTAVATKKPKAKKVDEENDSNMHGVYLHVVADALGSVSVIISSLLVQYAGITIADPICSFAISAMIFVGVMPLLRTTATTLLQSTPSAFDKKLTKCLSKVMQVEGVSGYSNLHFWKHAGNLLVGTIHIHIAPTGVHQKILAQVSKIFKKKGVKNLTVEITRRAY